MSSGRRVLLSTAVGVASLVIPLFAAASAEAITGSANCTIAGKASVNPPVQLTGGSGSYSFAALNFVCVTQTSAGNSTDDLTTSSTGKYNNTVCGTGTAGSGPLNPPDPFTFGSTNGADTRSVADTSAGVNAATWNSILGAGNNLSYNVVFSNTSGPITLVETSPHGVTGSGTIAIQATGPSTPPNCTSSFSVTGTLSGTITS